MLPAHALAERWRGGVKGKDTSLARFHKYYAFRLEEIKRNVAMLWIMPPNQRLLAVKFAAIYFL
jgi:hypothetical protein